MLTSQMGKSQHAPLAMGKASFHAETRAPRVKEAELNGRDVLLQT